MLTIIGCGNLNRCDDAVGVWVAQSLQQVLKTAPNQDVQVYDCGTAGMEVMFQARGSRALVIIDASSTGSEPGTVYKVPGEVLERLPDPGYNLHDFRWNHAIAAGRKIFKDEFPKDVTVYLIEAESLGFGLELSTLVKQSGDRVLSELVSLVTEYHEATAIEPKPEPSS